MRAHYFTSKTEIKPQLSKGKQIAVYDYFTSKTEIKPQPFCLNHILADIILHQRLKSNHNLQVVLNLGYFIILHQRLKSNHNKKMARCLRNCIILHQRLKSNHNLMHNPQNQD